MHILTPAYKRSSTPLLFWVGVFLGLTALGMGAMHTWAAVTSSSMNPDGISYLDIGEAYWRGDWANAINSVWSPMYSWILGLALIIFQPSMRWEFPLVHLVNFAIYVANLASFIYLWKQVLEYQRERLAASSERQSIAFPEWAMLSIGLLLFIWSSLTLIKIWAVTPDMLMTAILYLAAAMMVRIRGGSSSRRSYGLLGILLGLSFLAKTVMLPVAFLFLLASLFAPGGIQKSGPRTLVALLFFLLVASPFIILLSIAKGHFTYGEIGRLTYIRHVNGIPYPHWQGQPPEFGTPVHPSRKIFDNPPIYEFGSPVGGTYPITYDPSYWYEGALADYSLMELASAVLPNLRLYLDQFFKELGPVMAVLLTMYLFTWDGLKLNQKNIRPGRLGNWSLAIPAFLALGMYSLVYVEGRYIGGFIILIAADLLANLAIPDTLSNRHLLSAAGAVLVIFLFGNLVLYNLEGVGALSSRTARQQAPSEHERLPSGPGEVAEALLAVGVSPGEQVGVIGYAFDSYWARLARVRIVAEMLEWEAVPFYNGTPEFQAQVIGAFAGAGVRAIVAERVPAYATLQDWQQVGQTNYYIYRIEQP